MAELPDICWSSGTPAVSSRTPAVHSHVLFFRGPAAVGALREFRIPLIGKCPKQLRQKFRDMERESVSKSSMECPWNQFHLGRINNKIIFILENMGGYLPRQCAENLTAPLFPQNVFSDAEEDSVPMLALKTSQLFSQVFDGNQPSMPWNQMKVQLLNNLVFRQTSNLQQCVDQDGVTDAETTATALATFADQLAILHVQENQMCAWELRRYEFRLAFAQLKRFLDNRRKPNSMRR